MGSYGGADMRRETINPECSGHSELLKAKLGDAQRFLGPPSPPVGDVLKVLTWYKTMHSYMLLASLPPCLVLTQVLAGPQPTEVMAREEVEV